MKATIAVFVMLGLLAGCVEPPYRTEVRDTGGGTIQVVTVPKDPEPIAPRPAPATATPPTQVTPAAAQNMPMETPAAQSLTEQQRIDQLEAQVKALLEENQKLKQAAPTTAPSPQ